jgi:hypothetical protein
MINSVFTFNNLQRENKIVRDYTGYYFNELENFLKAYDDYFEIIDVDENTKIEKLSYDLYGDENYADLILAVNNENFLWSSPYDQDVILNTSESILRKFANELNLETFDETESYRDFADKVKEEIENQNSHKKYFKVPKKDKLMDVLSLISTYKNNHKSGV